MYVFKSKALRQYSDGYIIIEAPTLASAKLKAWGLFQDHLERYCDYAIEDYCNGYTEELERLVGLFEEDLRGCDVREGLLLMGSE